MGSVTRAGSVTGVVVDLFSGGGGAGVGYWLAGFEVVGMDIAAQAHYPFEMVGCVRSALCSYR